MAAWALIFAQHVVVGLVARTVAERDVAMVFVFAFCQQLLWWWNMSTRLRLEHSRSAAFVFAAVSAAGIAVGAWLWR